MNPWPYTIVGKVFLSELPVIVELQKWAMYGGCRPKLYIKKHCIVNAVWHHHRFDSLPPCKWHNVSDRVGVSFIVLLNPLFLTEVILPMMMSSNTCDTIAGRIATRLIYWILIIIFIVFSYAIACYMSDKRVSGKSVAYLESESRHATSLFTCLCTNHH